MKLDEIDLDDVGLGEEGTEEQHFDEDTYEKGWMQDGQHGEEVSEETEEELIDADEDLVTVLLKDKGINPDSIKFENEAGEIEELKFSDLSKEEQLEILNYNSTDVDYGLDEEELGFLNELRTNNISVQDYVEYQKRLAVQEYLENNSEETPVYQVDSIPDDELYIADLKLKIPELTDEDALAELELAKQNEALYEKKVQGIRNEYKQREDLLVEQQEQEQQQKAKEAAEAFEEEIVTAIQENDTIDLGESSLTLSEDDMNEIASFILDEDATGVRHIAKALNDPKTLVGMVWYALKGQEAFGQISEYYKQKITEASRYNYQKGFEDAKAGKTAAKSVVRKSTTKPTGNAKKPLSINDLD